MRRRNGGVLENRGVCRIDMSVVEGEVESEERGQRWWM